MNNPGAVPKLAITFCCALFLLPIINIAISNAIVAPDPPRFTYESMN